MDEAPETSQKSLIEHRIRIIMEMDDGISEEELSELLRSRENEMNPPFDFDSRVQEMISVRSTSPYPPPVSLKYVPLIQQELITAESKYKEKISQLEEKIQMLQKTVQESQKCPSS